MACPDRMNDSRIIAEIERRKAMKGSMFDLNAKAVAHLQWHGDLFSIPFDDVEQNRIVFIEQINPGEWLIMYVE